MAKQAKTISGVCPSQNTTQTMALASTQPDGHVVYECQGCGGRWTSHQIEAANVRMCIRHPVPTAMRGEIEE